MALFLLMQRKIYFPLSLVLLVVLLGGCTPATNSWKLSGSTMGTRYHITVVDVPAQLHRAQLQQLIDRELKAVNQEMSTYIPDSELMRFNRAPVSEEVEVSEHLAQVVGLSLDIYRQSQGAFDITVGPLVDLWGFGPEPQADKVPSDEAINKLTQVLGSDALSVRDNPPRLEKSRPVAIDLSAIAKGHGVDRVAELLHSHDIENYMVEIGGELRTLGTNPKGERWSIGIESPNAAGRVVQRAIHVSGKAVATSGDYRNYYEYDGKRYAHSIDPRTGRPLEHKLASVTVIADTCAEADGLATALNVMGEAAALALAERENLAIFLLVKTSSGFEERYSRAFSPFLDGADAPAKKSIEP